MAPTLPPLSRLAKRLHPHARGWLAEKIALAHYSLQGYRLLERRQQPKLAQTDLILRRNKTMVMVEVKYRTNRQRGHLALAPAQKERLHRQMLALAGRHAAYTIRLEVFLVFPHWPFLQRIRHVD